MPVYDVITPESVGLTNWFKVYDLRFKVESISLGNSI